MARENNSIEARLNRLTHQLNSILPLCQNERGIIKVRAYRDAEKLVLKLHKDKLTLSHQIDMAIKTLEDIERDAKKKLEESQLKLL